MRVHGKKSFVEACRKWLLERCWKMIKQVMVKVIVLVKEDNGKGVSSKPLESGVVRGVENR